MAFSQEGLTLLRRFGTRKPLSDGTQVGNLGVQLCIAGNSGSYDRSLILPLFRMVLLMLNAGSRRRRESCWRPR
ncbi:hypothetical protein D9M72_314750 [compost metagenome]